MNQLETPAIASSPFGRQTTPAHRSLPYKPSPLNVLDTPLHGYEQITATMADVEMTDAAPKKAKAGPSGGEVDGKKRFEVKKVGKRA